MKHLLDQPVWNALVSGNRNLSHGTETGKYFDIPVAPFVDVKEQHVDHFNALYDTLPTGRGAVIFSVEKNLNVGQWSKAGRIDGFQMLYNGQSQKLIGQELIRPLGENNVDAMLSLTAQTEPGPFLRRTIDFGHFYGIFHSDRLVAMAGQRLNPENFAEISGVCTHPDFTGKGFAKKLILHQIKRIHDAGQLPFLHVKSENFNAVRLYQSIGFEIRTEIFIHLLKR